MAIGYRLSTFIPTTNRGKTMSNKQEFITGSEAVLRGALEGGAEIMFGYPITPATEILQYWIKQTDINQDLKFLQTEDETSAGFAVIGSLLAGKKAFTATAGPGTILMQDPLSMAENQRLPFVCIVMQRGGPSTGTVNYSQQEVNLTAFGGNGDGLRVVYSASSISDLYLYTAKAFSTAWKYRFPTFVLGDGYLAKMRTKVVLPPLLKSVAASPILKEAVKPTFIRNCFSSEDEFFEDRLKVNIADWQKMKLEIVESESYKLIGASEMIIAHGSVAETAKDAIDMMRKNGKKIGLFRPITLNPFDTEKLRKAIVRMKKVYIIESSLNQLSRIVKYEIAGIPVSIKELSKPAKSFSADEIIKLVSK